MINYTCSLCGKAFAKGKGYMRHMQKVHSVSTGTLFDAKDPNLVNYFWSRVGGREHEDGCWEWSGATTQRGGGYGQLSVDGKTTAAHRVAYALSNCMDLSEMEGQSVLHSCDNPPCCNPRHLRLGTQMDNVQDAIERGRHVHGERHKAATISDEQAKRVKELASLGKYTQQEIADMIGCDAHVVAHIGQGKTWKHIDGPKAMTRERKPVPEFDVEQMIDLRKQGMSGVDIAELYGISYGAVYRFLRKAGITRESNGRVSR